MLLFWFFRINLRTNLRDLVFFLTIFQIHEYTTNNYVIITCDFEIAFWEDKNDYSKYRW